MKIYNILVPVDFSDNSINALQWGHNIAERAGAALHIMHCYEDSATYAYADFITLTDTITESVVKSKLKELRALNKKVKKHTTVKTHFGVTFGYPQKDINEYAKENSIDLIVMGTKGRKNVLNKLMGSITAGVIESTNIPVLAIPEGYTGSEIKSIIFANDFKKVTPEKSLNIIVTFALLYHSMLKIFNVTKDGEGAEVNTEEVKNITRAFRKIPYVYAFTAGKKSKKDIIDFLEKEKPDLLVIVPGRHSLIFNLISQSVTEYVVHRINIPMLAVRG